MSLSKGVLIAKKATARTASALINCVYKPDFVPPSSAGRTVCFLNQTHNIFSDVLRAESVLQCCGGGLT